MTAREALFSKLDCIEKTYIKDSPDKISTDNLPHSDISPEEITNRFLTSLQESGGEGYVLEDAASVSMWLAAYSQKHNCTEAVLSADEGIQRLGILDHFLQVLPSVQMLPCPEPSASEEAKYEFLARSEAAQIGIGSAAYGIAESGAIVMICSACESRSLSLLPLTHIAVLNEEDIVPDLQSIAGAMSESLLHNRTSAWTLIAGPSKTADIEKVLITGVHGPKNFIVLIIKQNSKGMQ
jgi:L-lactate utilization protein LutC